jgi:hypothetical protein
MINHLTFVEVAQAIVAARNFIQYGSDFKNFYVSIKRNDTQTLLKKGYCKVILS